MKYSRKKSVNSAKANQGPPNDNDVDSSNNLRRGKLKNVNLKTSYIVSVQLNTWWM